MKRFALATLLIPVLMWAIARPAGTSFGQSPLATPTAPASPQLPTTPEPTDTAGPPATPAAIPPLVWIAAGLLLGGVIILIARRTTPS